MNLFRVIILLLVLVSPLTLFVVSTRPCVPKEDKVGLIIGQDYWSIRNYTAYYHSDNPHPFGLASYTALDGINGHLTGLWSPINYGSGVEWVGGLHEAYPASALQLGLYLVDAEERTANGELDAEIDFLAEFLREFKNSVYLRIGYEFDSKENHYDAPKYIAAFRRIVDRIRGLTTVADGSPQSASSSLGPTGASNVAFVWHAAAFEPRDKMSIEDWFPGEDYVDWCGVSLFQQPYDCKEEFTFEGCMEYAQTMAKFCKQKEIPLMIAESTPFGGIVTAEQAKKDPRAENGAGYIGSTWVGWFTTVLHFIDRFDVRLWTYINCDWDSQPMWRKNRAHGQHWGDTRVQTHSDVATQWRNEVLKNKKFSWATNVMPKDYGEKPAGDGEGNSTTGELRRRHPQLESSSSATEGYLFSHYCEDEESIATRKYKLAHESWAKRLWGWVSTGNDEEDGGGGERYTFTASDFAVLCITLLVVSGGAYALFLYMNPTFRAERSGYQII